ncbi:HAD family hydrolase [Dissulfurispira sp.]|uniref:HAD family hydrolase n=1 Tax=Dissulfurispira sp. TaxID=2817609 RepID=UPI002FD98B76
MPIKLIIFDLDGTLIDSSIDITNAINYAIEPYGVKPVTVQETIGLVGEGITRLMEKIIDRGQKSEDRSQTKEIDKDILVDRFLEHYSAHLVDKTTVYPGVRETLERLKDYKKAVISNKREALSTKILNDLGLLKYLDLVVGSDTTPERKPSPVPILHVLSKLNIRPEDAVIVGDSNFDIEAGKAAGIKTIAVTYGYRPLDLLKGADFIINRMDELIDILKRFDKWDLR